MSIVVRHQVVDLTREQYDEVTRRMGDAWPPAGLQLHVLFGTDGDLKVSEIWDSEQQFRSFVETLMPAIQEVGVRVAGEPQIFEVRELEQPRS